MYFASLSGWLRWQEGLHPLAIDLGLERVAAVYAAMNPHRHQPLTLTVAGTNGKGSCVAYLEAIYLAQGYKVGAYTSPHILRYNERIKISGQPVDDASICAAFERLEAVRDGRSLSYFEFGTLAALDIFWRSEVDVQILEVGLGGRLDAVNIVDPDVSLISSIGIDHVYWLGDNREAIGREKAGIFRPGVPAIIGDPNPPASLAAVAAEKNALPFFIGQDFHYQNHGGTWDWSAVLPTGSLGFQGLPLPALQGEHQFRNAAAVLLATQCLAERLPVSEAAIRTGLARVQLQGRFQLFPGDIPVLVDVSHNPEAAQTLAEHLSQAYPNRRVLALFAMMRDKDISGVLEIMAPHVDTWFFVPLTNPRTITETAMQGIFLQSQISKVSFGHADFAAAFAAAKAQAKPGDLLLVFGSFFLVSDCLQAFETSELSK